MGHFGVSVDIFGIYVMLHYYYFCRDFPRFPPCLDPYLQFFCPYSPPLSPSQSNTSLTNPSEWLIPLPRHHIEMANRPPDSHSSTNRVPVTGDRNNEPRRHLPRYRPKPSGSIVMTLSMLQRLPL